MQDSDAVKINFLEKILKFAEEHPEIITDNGRLIFQELSNAYEEGASIGLHIDSTGRAYFEYFADWGDNKETEGESMKSAKELFHRAKRYFPKKIADFKSLFHIYDKAKGENESHRDYLDEIR